MTFRSTFSWGSVPSAQCTITSNAGLLRRQPRSWRGCTERGQRCWGTERGLELWWDSDEYETVFKRSFWASSRCQNCLSDIRVSFVGHWTHSNHIFSESRWASPQPGRTKGSSIFLFLSPIHQITSQLNALNRVGQLVDSWSNTIFSRIVESLFVSQIYYIIFQSWGSLLVDWLITSITDAISSNDGECPTNRGL